MPLTASVVAIPAHVGSNVDTANTVAQLPGQQLIEMLPAPLPRMLISLYEEHYGAPTAGLLVPSLADKDVTVSILLALNVLSRDQVHQCIQLCRLFVKRQSEVAILRTASVSYAFGFRALKVMLVLCSW